jgi:phosphoserine phosphatase
MAKPNAIRVLFLRTGQTEWEQAGRLAGSTDVPLSAEGREGVRAAVAGLVDVHLSTIFCGPDEASVASAEELALVAGGKVRRLEDLGEVSLGLWEGLLATELEEKCPRAYKQWLEDPSVVQVPDGESLEDARVRIVETLAQALEKVRWGNGGVGVVLHPMALGLVGCSLNDAPTASLWTIIKTAQPISWRTLERGTLRQTAVQVRDGI